MALGRQRVGQQLEVARVADRQRRIQAQHARRQRQSQLRRQRADPRA
jgi:hypothetical protein